MVDLESLDELQRERLRDMGFRVPGLPVAKPKPNKYRAKRTEYNGVTYDSKAEAEYAKNLNVLQELGKVDWWLRQVTVPLGPDFKTRVDFLISKPIVCQNSNVATHICAVEVKGVETREFRKVRELWQKYGPFDLHIIKRSNVEIIEGKA